MKRYDIGAGTIFSSTELREVFPYFTRVAFRMPTDATYDQWQKAGAALARIGRGYQWWIGDWLALGESKYGDKYKSATQILGIEYQTCANLKHVASRVEPERRRENLSFSHHALVAPLNEPEQEDWLRKAEQHGWGVKELANEIKEARRIERVATVEVAAPGAHVSVREAVAPKAAAPAEVVKPRPSAPEIRPEAVPRAIAAAIDRAHDFIEAGDRLLANPSLEYVKVLFQRTLELSVELGVLERALPGYRPPKSYAQ